MWLQNTHTGVIDKLIWASYSGLPPTPARIRPLCRPPVEVPVDDGLGEIVQVLHALGHVDGNDELGLQVDEPVH